MSLSPLPTPAPRLPFLPDDFSLLLLLDDCQAINDGLREVYPFWECLLRAEGELLEMT